MSHNFIVSLVRIVLIPAIGFAGRVARIDSCVSIVTWGFDCSGWFFCCWFFRFRLLYNWYNTVFSLVLALFLLWHLRPSVHCWLCFGPDCGSRVFSCGVLLLLYLDLLVMRAFYRLILCLSPFHVFELLSAIILESHCHVFLESVFVESAWSSAIAYHGFFRVAGAIIHFSLEYPHDFGVHPWVGSKACSRSPIKNFLFA